MFSVSLAPSKRAYFASDFHLGLEKGQAARDREAHVVAWLDSIAADAQVLFLLGDCFDFWWEYKKVVPRGFTRFLGALARLSDQGVDIHFFTGNHDIWTFGYLQEEVGLTVHGQPATWDISGALFHLGHGDGLGPGDRWYKALKKLFVNRPLQVLYSAIHPRWGVGLGQAWSRDSRYAQHADTTHYGKRERIYQYCQQVEAQQHHDYYLFGHRHLVMDMPLGESSRYINLGEWVHAPHYAAYDGNLLTLRDFPPTH